MFIGFLSFSCVFIPFLQASAAETRRFLERPTACGLGMASGYFSLAKSALEKWELIEQGQRAMLDWPPPPVLAPFWHGFAWFSASFGLFWPLLDRIWTRFGLDARLQHSLYSSLTTRWPLWRTLDHLASPPVAVSGGEAAGAAEVLDVVYCGPLKDTLRATSQMLSVLLKCLNLCLVYVF